MHMYSQVYPSIYRGTVVDNKDPKNLGRCKVRVGVTGKLAQWARPIVLSPINKSRGSVNIPDIGDVVWIIYENSNKDYPLYLGGIYSIEDIPINLNKVVLYVEDGNELSYDRENKSYQLKVKDQSIQVDASGIHLNGNVLINGKTIESMVSVEITKQLLKEEK